MREVLSNEGLEPSLGVGVERVMCQKWNGERDVGSWWCEVAIQHRFVDNLQRFGTAWFFQVGGHAADGIEFKICMAWRQLRGCLAASMESAVCLVRLRSVMF